MVSFLIIGIICLLLIPIVIFLYIKKIKKEKNKEPFKVTEIKKTRYEIFHFWNHVVYIFLVFTLIVAAIVLIPVGVSTLV